MSCLYRLLGAEIFKTKHLMWQKKCLFSTRVKFALLVSHHSIEIVKSVLLE